MTDRARGLKAIDKAMRQCQVLSDALGIQFCGFLRTDSALQIYCVESIDLKDLCELALAELEAAPEGATLN